MRSVQVLLLAAVLAPPATAQPVLSVKPTGTGDFTTVQPAIDASAPGDILLVFGGIYYNVTIDHGLTLVDMDIASFEKPQYGPGADLPALSISGVPADELVVLSGFTFVVSGAGTGVLIDV